ETIKNPKVNVHLRSPPRTARSLTPDLATVSTWCFITSLKTTSLTRSKSTMCPASRLPCMRVPDMSLGFKVPFGQKTTARVYAETVTKVNRDATPCSKNLPNVTYTMNYSYPDNFENQSFFGDYQDCVIRIKQEEFRDTCGCLGTHLPLPSEPHERHVLHQNIYAVTFRHDDGTVGHTDYRISNWSEPDDRSFDFDKLIMLSDYLKDNWDSLNFNRSKTFLRCYDQVLNRQKSQGVTTTNCKVRCTKNALQGHHDHFQLAQGFPAGCS
uniref:CUB domain-containing protein n=1 Tax=Macrostomum lignano TaxID=282301 RepID=A0A1I8IMA9_9PLAT